MAARCHRMEVAADTPCHPTVVADLAEAAHLRMAVEVEVTHHPMVAEADSVEATRRHTAVAEVMHPRTVAVVAGGVLPADSAEAEAMPRLRAAMGATTVEAEGPTAVLEAMDTVTNT